MKMNEVREPVEFIKFDENFILDTDKITGTATVESKKFAGVKQHILFFKGNTAVTISHALFIGLRKAEKQTNATKYKFEKRKNDKGFEQWLPIALNPQGQETL